MKKQKKRPTYYAVVAHGDVVAHFSKKRDAKRNAKKWKGHTRVKPRFGNIKKESVKKRMKRELHGGHY